MRAKVAALVALLAASIALAQDGALVPGDGPIASLGFTQDGKQLLAGDARGDVSVRDGASGKERRKLSTNKGPILLVGFVADGKELVTVDGRQVCRRGFPHAEDEPVVTAIEGSFPIECAALDTRTSTLALGVGRRILVRDLATNKERARLETDDFHVVKAVALSPGGERIVSGDGSGHVRFWDATSGKLVRELRAKGRSERLAFGGSVLALGGGGLVLLDTTSGALVDEGAPRASALAFSPAGDRLAVGTVDGAVELRDARTGQLLATAGRHEVEVRALAFSPDGQRLASADKNGTVGVWSIAGALRRR